MAFKEITNSGNKYSAYWPKKAAEREVGDSVTGYFRGSVKIKQPSGEDGILYDLETETGMVGVNSSATIDRAMSQIPLGSLVKIVFNGKKRSPKSGREYNDFGVFVDDGEGTKEESTDFSNFSF